MMRLILAHWMQKVGRKRKKENEWLPPYTSRGKSAYEYRPPEGGYFKLCPLDAKQSEVYEAYEKYADTRNITFQRIYDLFKLSPQHKDLAPRTQLDYTNYAKFVMPVFGKHPPNKIKIFHIRKYMDKRGNISRSRANKELSFMSVMFKWGRERNYCNDNPCFGVKKYAEKDREKYITHEEYEAVYANAIISVQVAMDISYLCASRQADVLNLKWGKKGQRTPAKNEEAVILEQGIYIRQGKTGKQQIKLWTDSLRAAINLAKKQIGVKSAKYVIHNQSGKKFTGDGFRTYWSKAYRKTYPDMSIKPAFTFHDIKAKGVSDYDGDKLIFSGHKTRRAMEVYNRDIQEVEAHNFSKKRSE